MPFRILVADDSPTMRAFLRRTLGATEDLRVAHAVADGEMAIEAVERGDVDAAVLDVEMPVMNGIEALDAIREIDPELPVIVLSAHTTRGSATAITAMAAGADDLVTKPTVDVPGKGRELVGQEIVEKLRALLVGGTKHSRRSTGRMSRDLLLAKRLVSASPGLVAIGASTGGPPALEQLLTAMPQDLPIPIVVAQHMPSAFTSHLAGRLDEQVALRVVEAQQGTPLENGTVYVAPGARHIEVVRHGGRDYVNLNDRKSRTGIRPSADRLFKSVAKVFGPRATAVVLTGMGRDGLDGAREIRRLGGTVYAQDQESSTVWGMPGNIARAGLASEVLPLGDIAPKLLSRIARAHARAAS